MMHCKSHSIAPMQRNDLRPRLHSRTLFRQHKLAAHKLLSGFREQNGHLYWEHMLTIEVPDADSCNRLRHTATTEESA